MSSYRTVYFSTFVAALGGFLFGFDTAVISGTVGSLERVFALEEFWLGFTVAVALIGTIVGAFTVGTPAERYGRRRILKILAVLFAVSALGSALAQTWIGFLVFRFLGGLAVGGASVATPMYIAEIAPGAMRGRLVAVNQLNVVVGILMAYLSNYVVALVASDPIAWRWMLGVEFFPAALFFVFLFGIPHSPRWLVKRGRSEEARGVLEMLGVANVGRELGQIQASLKASRRKEDERLFQKKYLFPIFLAWAVAMFNQLSGINALMYYAPRIFEMAGAGEADALLRSVAVGGTNLLFTLVAMALIDRIGRRLLLLVGSVGTAVCMALVASQFYAAAVSGTLVLVGLLGFIAFFAMSQGAVIWVFISEVFPNRVRSKGQSLGSFTHWVMAALVSWVFPVVAENAAGHAFAFFGLMMVVQFFFAWKVLPETKELTLEELERKLGIGTEELERMKEEDAGAGAGV